MTIQQPKSGDRVRVVLEGEASRWSSDHFTVGENVIHPAARHVVSIEVLPPPEPEWVEGDVVRSAAGAVYGRTSASWMPVGGSIPVPHAFPTRPLTRLVPERQS